MLRFVFLAVITLAACAGIIAWNHPCTLTTWEKVAQLLASPVGVTWLALLMAVVAAFSWKKRQTGWLFSLLLVFYTTAGSLPVGQWLIGFLEADFPPTITSKAEHVDYLVVLGGGLAVRGDGALALGQSGDRLALAARLFHAGKCGRLVATGAEFTGARGSRPRRVRIGPQPEEDQPQPANYAAETARLLVELGVRADRIDKVGGYNTKTEVAAIAAFAAEHPGGTIGIVTSAWHMSRVTRLAQSYAIDFSPFPADHETGVDELYYFPIPVIGGLRRCERAIKELIAMGVGR